MFWCWYWFVIVDAWSYYFIWCDLWFITQSSSSALPKTMTPMNSNADQPLQSTETATGIGTGVTTALTVDESSKGIALLYPIITLLEYKDVLITLLPIAFNILLCVSDIPMMRMKKKVSSQLSHKRKPCRQLVASVDQPNFLLLEPLRLLQKQTEVAPQQQERSLSPLYSWKMMMMIAVMTVWWCW